MSSSESSTPARSSNDRERPREWSAWRLGLVIRRARMSQALSQRQLAAAVGLGAHSGISDFERGRRIPCGDIMSELERVLADDAAALRHHYQRALRERADNWFAVEVEHRTERPSPDA